MARGLLTLLEWAADFSLPPSFLLAVGCVCLAVLVVGLSKRAPPLEFVDSRW